jgi:hypothetical protein
MFRVVGPLFRKSTTWWITCKSTPASVRSIVMFRAAGPLSR